MTEFELELHMRGAEDVFSRVSAVAADWAEQSPSPQAHHQATIGLLVAGIVAADASSDRPLHTFDQLALQAIHIIDARRDNAKET
jgi:hypothetical protein